MRPDNRTKSLRRRLLSCVALGAMTVNVLAPIAAAEAQTSSPSNTRTSTPIKHLIVVIGENRSFDNVFATYVPSDPRQSVWNLLSQGIVDKTGAPGLNAAKALQRQATDTSHIPVGSVDNRRVFHFAAAEHHAQWVPGLALRAVGSCSRCSGKTLRTYRFAAISGCSPPTNNPCFLREEPAKISIFQPR